MDTLAEVRHQMPKRTGFPLLVERLQAFRHTISRWRDLIRVDGIPLPGEFCARKAHRIPEDQRSASDNVSAPSLRARRWRRIRERLELNAFLQPRWFNCVQLPFPSLPMLSGLLFPLRLIPRALEHRQSRITRKARVGGRKTTQVKNGPASARHNADVGATGTQTGRDLFRLP